MYTKINMIKKIYNFDDSKTSLSVLKHDYV
jgi:hypothetical protein